MGKESSLAAVYIVEQNGTATPAATPVGIGICETEIRVWDVGGRFRFWLADSGASPGRTQLGPLLPVKVCGRGLERRDGGCS